MAEDTGEDGPEADGPEPDGPEADRPDVDRSDVDGPEAGAPGAVGDPADPGWQGVRAYRGRLVLPSFAMRRARDEVDRLTGLRAVFTSTVAIHVVIGAIALIAIGSASSTGDLSIGLAAALVVVVGAGVAYARWRMAARPADCADGKALADGYYISFLKQTAYVSLILPWGIVAGLFSGSVAVAGLGVAAAGVVLVWMAPTREQVAGDAARVREQGCDADLVLALVTGGAEGGPGAAGRRRGGGDRPAGGPRSAGGSDRPGGSDNRSKKKRKRR